MFREVFELVKLKMWFEFKNHAFVCNDCWKVPYLYQEHIYLGRDIRNEKRLENQNICQKFILFKDNFFVRLIRVKVSCDRQQIDKLFGIFQVETLHWVCGVTLKPFKLT